MLGLMMDTPLLISSLMVTSTRVMESIMAPCVRKRSVTEQTPVITMLIRAVRRNDIAVETW